MSDKKANKDNPKWQEAKRILEKDAVSSSDFSAVLSWLADLQKDYKTVIHFELFDDGSGSIEHEPHGEPEIIKEWDTLEEMLELMGPR